ncbi:hypothetical protein NDU88_005786 [Pleurodeles waltl]|uniref:CCHC-type domain-containing protein n=1 Tax=Pleurodeles waltl TaxID=8319 RepID=A0AAV7WCT3_PLEWA|nr:hypothetical protein NDU88_005786 [Pleurodeles waltl]
MQKGCTTTQQTERGEPETISLNSALRMADESAPATRQLPQHKMTGHYRHSVSLRIPPQRHLDGRCAHDDYEAAVRALNAHFDPQLNPDFERFKLRQARQREGESIDQLYARLRELASTCTDDDQPKEVRAQIIQGCRNKTLSGLILRQPNITLDEILIMAQSHDLLVARAAEMDMAISHTPERTPVVKIECADAVQLSQTSRKTRPYAPIKSGGHCKYCGRDEHNPRDCPAQGRTCSNCGKLNHFAAVCKGGVKGRGSRGRRTPTRAVKQPSLNDHMRRGQTTHRRVIP